MVEIFLIIAIAIPVSALLWCVFMLHRNSWVYKQRMKVLHGENGFNEHQKLPSYDYMMRKFWVWDVNKFKFAGRVNKD
ncbi:hypothetical protein A8A01_03195 [Ewingella americana]|nr:hypothetical protein A8A01_03195 [Ewingella americana]